VNISVKNHIRNFLRSQIERFPILAETYRNVRTLLFQNSFANRAPVLTPFGFYFIGMPSMENGSYEQQEVRIAQQFIGQTDIFINVGANYGYYCCLALQAGARTIAFEPIEINLRLLYKNIIANGWQSKIEIFPLAIGERASLIEIYGAYTGASIIKGWAGNTSESLKSYTPISTLDTILGSRVCGQRCFILVDIEGAEFQMLKGAEEILKQKPKPIWMVEICVTEHQPKGVHINPYLEATFDMFWSHGYRSFTATDQRKEIKMSQIEIICKKGIDTLGTHNFLFLDSSEQ
jgi:FkbM family methyltransferase